MQTRMGNAIRIFQFFGWETMLMGFFVSLPQLFSALRHEKFLIPHGGVATCLGFVMLVFCGRMQDQWGKKEKLASLGFLSLLLVISFLELVAAFGNFNSAPFFWLSMGLVNFAWVVVVWRVNLLVEILSQTGAWAIMYSIIFLIVWNIPLSKDLAWVIIWGVLSLAVYIGLVARAAILAKLPKK